MARSDGAWFMDRASLASGLLMPQAPVCLLWQQAGTRALRVVVGNRASLRIVRASVLLGLSCGRWLHRKTYLPIYLRGSGVLNGLHTCDRGGAVMWCDVT